MGSEEPDGSSGEELAAELAKARRLLRIPAGICAVQAVALLMVSVSVVVTAGDEGSSAWGRAAYFVIFAAIMLAVARAVAAGRRWSRGPMLVIQLIIGLIGLTEAGLATWIGWVELVPAIVAIAVLLMPATAEVFSRK